MGLSGVLKYLKWSTRFSPMFVAFPNQLKLLPSGQMTVTDKQTNLKFNVRNNTRDINEVYSICTGYEYPADLLSRIRPNSVIFDLGGHIGSFSTFFALNCPKAVFVALEPEPSNFNLLKSNIELNKKKDQIIPLNQAVTEKSGVVRLGISANNNAHSLVSDQAENYVEVEGIALDLLIQKYAQNLPYAIKMDIEGAEYSVLKAHSQSVKNAQLVILEWHYDDHNKSERHEWLVKYFSDLGFKINDFNERVILATR